MLTEPTSFSISPFPALGPSPICTFASLINTNPSFDQQELLLFWAWQWHWCHLPSKVGKIEPVQLRHIWVYIPTPVNTQALVLTGLYLYRKKAQWETLTISLRWNVQWNTELMISNITKRSGEPSYKRTEVWGSTHPSTRNTHHSPGWLDKFRRASHLHILSPIPGPTLFGFQQPSTASLNYLQSL